MKLSLNNPVASTSEAWQALDVARLNPDLSSSNQADRQGMSEWGQQLILLLVGLGFMGGIAALMSYLVSAA
jgi:hypothetical protein